MRNDFVKDDIEILDTLIEFNKVPNYQRKMVGNNPIYFIHSMFNGSHQFGLSKFCAFKNILAEDYLQGRRHYAGGAETQEHLSSVTKQEWKAYNTVGLPLQNAFNDWITKTFPKFRKFEKIKFITITAPQTIKTINSKRIISSDDLDKLLEQRKVIGTVGEQIALKYEIERLAKLGASNPMNHITHTAEVNSGAGFDIYTDYERQVRYIEVKSSTIDHSCIYITKNEIDTFKANGKSSYIYLVSITDLKNKQGSVKEVTALETLGEPEPVLFKIKHKH